MRRFGLFALLWAVVLGMAGSRLGLGGLGATLAMACAAGMARI